MSDSPADWDRVKQLFQAALDRPKDERIRYLHEACDDDRALLREVESLLVAHEQAGDFAERPAIEGFVAGSSAVKPSDDAPADRELRPGLRLGPYQIVERIGRGGMGEVYRARDTRLGRSVAIKVMPVHVATDATLKHRFEREARTLAALSHPHICPVFDVGQQDGIDYLVMEHLEGETLAARLAGGPLPLDQALRYATEIADALDKAHRQGIVHRDLKPGNIMLSKGVAKLLDFGLAKRKPVGPFTGLSAAAIVSGPLTAQGMILGTVNYMAPEQVEGKEADARSDMFSFGAVLYEMVSGARAFEGESPANVMAAVLERDPPSLSQLQPLMPATLEQLVQRCLAKDPDDRWQTARDVHEQLNWIRRTATTTPAPRSGQSWRWVAAASTLAAALISVLLWSVNRRGETLAPRDVTRLLISIPAFAPLSRTPGADITIARDGSRIAYLAEHSADRLAVYVRNLDQLDAQQIPGSQLPKTSTQVGNGATPFFSPDGKSIGFRTRDGIMRVLLAGGPPSQILSDPAAFLGAEWEPGETLLYAGGLSVLYRVSATGGGVPRRLNLDPPEGTHYLSPRGLPGTTAVLSTQLRGMPQVQSVVVLDPEVGRPRVLVEQGGSPVFATSGHLVFQRGTTLMAAPFDVNGLVITGAASPVQEGVSPRDWDLSRNGTLIYIPMTANAAVSGTLVWMNRAGRVVGSAIDRPIESPKHLRLSPRGRQLALISGGDPTAIGGDEIWIHDLSGRPPLPLVQKRINSYPVWSPDGARLAFTSGGSGALPVFWLPADASNQEPVRVDGGAMGGATEWLADDRILVTTRVPGAEYDIRITPAAGGSSQALVATKDTERKARLSPDRRWLAYESDRSGRFEIWVSPFPPGAGAPVLVSRDGGLQPVWSRDGKELFYLQADRLMAVAVKGRAERFEFDRAAELFTVPYVVEGAYDVAADGRFLMIQPTAQSGATPAPGEIVVVQNWDQELKRLVPTR